MTNNKIEQYHKLKDGRTIYKTHNGFKCWLLDKGATKPIEVDATYYTKAMRHSVNFKKG